MLQIRLKNRCYLSIIPLILACVGCAAVNSNPNDNGAVCGQPQIVQSTDEFVRFLTQIEWTPIGGYSNRLPVASQDVFIAGTLTLAATQIPVPQACLNRHDCRHDALLTVSSSLSGVECQANDVGGCETVSMADTTVRFRGIMRDTHPSRWNFSPTLELLSACSAPCESGEFRCPTDNTCWSSFDAYCRLCGGQTKEACACQSPEGILPDGSECHFWMSGDVIQSGTCQVGVCRSR